MRGRVEGRLVGGGFALEPERLGFQQLHRRTFQQLFNNNNSSKPMISREGAKPLFHLDLILKVVGSSLGDP